MKTADARPRVKIVRPPVFLFVLALSAMLVMMSGCSRGPAESNVNLNVNTNGYPQPYARGGMMMKAAMMDSAPTPEVEAGTSQVSMSADGVIEVQMP